MPGSVAQAIERATLEVFALMVGVDIVPEAELRQDYGDHESNVVSSFRLTGAVRGTAEVFYTLPLARRITCQILQLAPPVDDADVLDAAGEVANMIVGNVKNSLEGDWGSICIGTPHVSLAAHEAITSQAMSVSFRCCEDVFTVSVAFKEDPARWDN
jgi:CheY-specific phosphatase CheX